MEPPQTGTVSPSTTAVASPPPPPPSSSSSLASKANGNGVAASKKLSPPTPEELVAHYEAQGLEPREASLRVIRDLQTILYRAVAAAPGRGKKERFVADTARKLDNVNTRLAIVEMKLDSKPGYPGLFAVGVAAGAALQSIAGAAPHVLGALGKMWETTVRSTTKEGRPSSP